MLIVFLGVMPVTEILAFLIIILKARMEEYLEHCLYYGWRIKVCVLRHDILNPCIYFKFYDKYIHWTDKYTYSCQMTVFRLSLYLSRNMTKSTIWHMRPAELRRSAWASTQFDQDPMHLYADSEDSDQTGRMPRLICLRCAHMPFCWFYHEAVHLSPLSQWRRCLRWRVAATYANARETCKNGKREWSFILEGRNPSWIRQPCIRLC